MQFGIFSVGDVTANPITGQTVSEAERIQVMLTVALKAEEIGLDVFAHGEHHNPPFVPPSPTTRPGHLAAQPRHHHPFATHRPTPHLAATPRPVPRAHPASRACPRPRPPAGPAPSRPAPSARAATSTSPASRSTPPPSP